MKKFGVVMICTGVLAGAGIATYVLMNKNTKQKANKLLNTMMDEAHTKIKRMN